MLKFKLNIKETRTYPIFKKGMEDFIKRFFVHFSLDDVGDYWLTSRLLQKSLMNIRLYERFKLFITRLRDNM